MFSWLFKKRPVVIIEKYRDVNGVYRWRLKGLNGEILGDNYKTKQMRDKTVSLLQGCRFEVKDSDKQG